MPVIMEISVIPTGRADPGLGEAVTEVLKVAEKHGVNYELNAMGTTIEGDLETLLKVAREMHEVCFGMGYPRVQTIIKLDDRRDKDLTMRYKVESVKSRLAKEALHIRES
ncbi:MAG: MTH1187 family thiamine-binding protein [Armatimonadota bacterium]